MPVFDPRAIVAMACAISAAYYASNVVLAIAMALAG